MKIKARRKPLQEVKGEGMGFKEDLAEDIDEVFFDEDFVGSRHIFEGEEITVIVDSEGLEEIEKRMDKTVNYKDEIHKKPVLLFVREADMKRKLTVNSAVEFDGEMYRVAFVSKSPGIRKMLLERHKV